MIILVLNNAKQMLLYHGIHIYFSYLAFVEPRYGAQFFILHQGLKNIGTALLGAWFQRELPVPSLFEMQHERGPWDLAGQNPAFGDLFNEGMVSDSSFIMKIVVEECGGIFKGVTSLIDVAGGLGGAATSIAKAFPELRCSVLDLPHVVASAPSGGNVQFVEGDMFQSIPPADAVFLKVTDAEIHPYL